MISMIVGSTDRNSRALGGDEPFPSHSRFYPCMGCVLSNWNECMPVDMYVMYYEMTNNFAVVTGCGMSSCGVPVCENLNQTSWSLYQQAQSSASLPILTPARPGRRFAAPTWDSFSFLSIFVVLVSPIFPNPQLHLQSGTSHLLPRKMLGGKGKGLPTPSVGPPQTQPLGKTKKGIKKEGAAGAAGAAAAAAMAL